MAIRTEERKGKMTVAEAGRKGGEKTASTHGREFYEKIGRKGGEKVSMERGPEFYSEIGSKGGSEDAQNNMKVQLKPKVKQVLKKQVTSADKEFDD